MTTPESTLSPEDIAAGWTADEWTYTGRNYSTAGKQLWHTFTDHTGARRLFAKAPSGPIVGGRYVVESKIVGDRITARIQDARYVGMAAAHDSTDLAGWRLRDRAAAAEQEAVRARKRAAGENGDFGAMTLCDVRAMVSRLPTTAQRAGTIAAVLAYIERG